MPERYTVFSSAMFGRESTYIYLGYILDSSKLKLRITGQEKNLKNNQIWYPGSMWRSFNKSFLIRKSIIFFLFLIRQGRLLLDSLLYRTFASKHKKVMIKNLTKKIKVLSHFYLSFTSKNKRVLIENVENLTIFCQKKTVYWVH